MVSATGSATSAIASKIEHSRAAASWGRQYAARGKVFPRQAPMQPALLCLLVQTLSRKRRKRLWRKRYTFSRTAAEPVAPLPSVSCIGIRGDQFLLDPGKGYVILRGIQLQRESAAPSGADTEFCSSWLQAVFSALGRARDLQTSKIDKVHAGFRAPQPQGHPDGTI